MRRGFKAHAERVATQVRSDMGKRPSDPLDAVDLARHVGAEVRCADELTSRQNLEELDQIQPGAFSACTFTIDGRHIVVYSPLASEGRTQSDVAHETAHLLLQHEVKTVKTIGSLSFFTCDADEEQEANWLAGCLLLPRPLLLQPPNADSTATQSLKPTTSASKWRPIDYEQPASPASSPPPVAVNNS